MNWATNKIRQAITPERAKIVGIVLVGILILNVFVVWYVMVEKKVYYWDDSAYWTSAIDLYKTFHVSKISGIQSILASLHTDYNMLPIVPFLPIMKLFGPSRLVFILSTINLYVIPFSLLTIWLYWKHIVGRLSNNRTGYLLLALLAVFGMPALLNPALHGQIDAVGLLIIAVIILIATKVKIERYNNYSILIGALLCLLVIERRWYSYWAVSAVALVCCFVVWKTVNIMKSRSVKDGLLLLRGATLNLAACGVVVGLMMKLLFPYQLDAYFMNYGDIYSAYKSGGLGAQLWRTINYFGVLPIVTMIIGCIVTARNKTSTYAKYLMLFFVLQSILIYVLFTRTQDFAAHHYYLFVPLFAFSYLAIVDYISHRSHRRLFISALFSCLILLGMVQAFIPQPYSQQMQLIEGEANPPMVRHDLGVLKDLAGYFRSNLKRGEGVYMVTSSDTINESLFRDTTLPEGYVDGVLQTAHIDKRDGFPNQFFGAAYVVVASPVQFHIMPSGNGQLVITSLNRRILGGECANLVKVKEYTIENGVTLVVYKKAAPYSDDFIQALIGEFTHTYATYPQLTNIHQ